ncbi:hypothetical protein T484DRAFT_1884369, partial [Baffinella frigidus]
MDPIVVFAAAWGASGPVRVVQRGRGVELANEVEVFLSVKGKGWGVRATRLIPKGAFVMEYVGEALELEEATQRRARQEAQGEMTFLMATQRRARQEAKGEMTFLMVVRENFGGRRQSTCMDARYEGNVARFVNHSCDPNLTMLCVRTGPARPRIAMFASRDVSPGEELSISYGDAPGHAPGTDSASAGKGGA